MIFHASPHMISPCLPCPYHGVEVSSVEQDVVSAGVLLFVLSAPYTVNLRASSLGHFITIKELGV